jgi:molecular chaperone HtpG
MEWRGRSDGTYTVKVLEREMEPGTEVQLIGKDGCAEYFEPDRVLKLARYYGSLLPRM